MSHVRWTRTPPLGTMSHMVVEASLTDTRDRSAPSDFHWKILKCRMLIFSESSILACPDYRDVKQVHVIIQRLAESFKGMYALLTRFGLAQKGELRHVTCEVFQACLQYSVTARIAPTWNLLGKSYFVNNRDFLTAKGPQYAVECSIYVTEERIEFNMKPLKITLLRTRRPRVGDWAYVLPSLNKAIVEERLEILPPGNFKSYKDLKRHWKNIHGYRLPEEETTYYLMRFWRGAPLTYPSTCITSSWPLLVPIPRSDQETTISKFLHHITSKLVVIMNQPVDFVPKSVATSLPLDRSQDMTAMLSETQAVSLCTPTQIPAASTASASASAAASAAASASAVNRRRLRE